MSDDENTKTRKVPPRKGDLHEARPLLQAIFLGIVLAAALVAAAVMTNPDKLNAAGAPDQPAAEISAVDSPSGHSADKL